MSWRGSTAIPCIRRIPRPLVWGIVYLLMIPAFAAMYDLLGAGSFYDANIQREPSLRADAQEVANAITGVLNSPGGDLVWHTRREPLAIPRNSLVASAIRHTSDGKLLLEISGQYSSLSGAALTQTGTFGEWLRILTFQAETVASLPNGRTVAGYGTTLSDMDGNPLERLLAAPPRTLLLPGFPGGSAPPPSPSGILLLPYATFIRLTDFYNAAEGDPWYASGRWLRMAYLSAITVTTLGFGDVTPVTPTARAIVALEAVLGLIVIGLFVNSVARQPRRARPA